MSLPSTAEIERLEALLQHAIVDKMPNPLSVLNDNELQLLEDLWFEDELAGERLSGRLMNYAHELKLFNPQLEKRLAMWGIKGRASKRRKQQNEIGRSARRKANEDTTEDRVRKLPDARAQLQRFNDNFVHTVLGQNDIVMRQHDLLLLRPRSFASLYNEPTKVIGPKGDWIVRAAGDVWLDHPERALARGGIVCEPEKPGGMLELKNGLTAFNTWQGLQLEEHEGDWSLMREMILQSLCSGEQEVFEYVLNWAAYRIQFPWRHAETTLVFTGPHGAGKSTFGLFFQKALGPRHCMSVSQSKAVVGDFNDHLRDVVVLIAEEAVFAGDPRTVQVFKDLVTSPVLSLHAKFGSRFMAPSRLGTLILTNDRHAIQSMRGDRRACVPDVREWHQNDTPYWESLYHQMDNGGWQAMLYDLRRRDLTGWRHRYPPNTATLQRQRQLSRQRTLDGWWETILTRGHVLVSEHGHEKELHVWPEFVSTPLLLQSFEQYARHMHFARHEIVGDRQLGEFMTRELDLPAVRPNGSPLIQENRDSDGGLRFGPRARGYLLPSLDEARASFDARHQEANTWDVPGTQLDLPSGYTGRNGSQSGPEPPPDDTPYEPDEEPDA